MWRTLTYCSRFLKQHKIQVTNDKIGQLTQITTKSVNDDSNNSICFKIDNNSANLNNNKNRTKSKTNLNANRLNYYKFDYYDYLCTILGINSVYKFGYKDKLKIPKFKMTNIKINNEESWKAKNKNCNTDNSLNANPQELPSIESNVDNQKKKNENELDNLFNELNVLNEQTVGKLENMIALEKLSQNKYEDAIPYLIIAAAKGYAKASFNLGLCYQDGLGVAKDEKMGFFYFKLAADNGHSEAAYNCAMYCLKYNENIEASIKYLRITVNNCNKNNKNTNNAKKILAVLLLNQKESYFEAFRLLNSINPKDAECDYYLGLCYENGLGTDKNLTKALEYYENSMKNGYEEAKKRFFDLKTKQNEQNILINNRNKKLGHFTHSTSQFETLKSNQTNKLKPSLSSSQLGRLFRKTVENFHIMN